MKFGIFLQHYFPYGGLQRDAVRLAEAAAQAGDTPVMIVSTWEGPKPAGFQIIELASGGSSNHRKAERFANDCQSMYQQEQLDTAICFSRVPGTPFHFCGDSCYKDRFLATKNLICKFLPRYKYLLENEQLLFGSLSSTHIFFLAASEIPAYQKLYSPAESKFTLLPPWIDTPPQQKLSKQELKAQLLKQLQLPTDSILLLFVGSNFHLKGLDIIIESLAHIENKRVSLIACGQDSPTEYLKLAEQHKVSGRVRIPGPSDNIADWMRSADLLVHPARLEAAGMVLVEALANELPVICSSNCGYSAVVENAGNIIIRPKSSPQELSQSILKALDKLPKLKKNIQEWSQSTAHTNTAEVILTKIRNSLL